MSAATEDCERCGATTKALRDVWIPTAASAAVPGIPENEVHRICRPCLEEIEEG